MFVSMLLILCCCVHATRNGHNSERGDEQHIHHRMQTHTSVHLWAVVELFYYNIYNIQNVPHALIILLHLNAHSYLIHFVFMFCVFCIFDCVRCVFCPLDCKNWMASRVNENQCHFSGPLNRCERFYWIKQILCMPPVCGGDLLVLCACICVYNDDGDSSNTSVNKKSAHEKKGK